MGGAKVKDVSRAALTVHSAHCSVRRRSRASLQLRTSSHPSEVVILLFTLVFVSIEV
jgi:hypothetical protein